MRQAYNAIKARGLGQIDGRLALKTQLDYRFSLARRNLRRNVCLDLGQVGLEAIVSMSQEYQAEHRHGIFGGGELGIGTQLVGCFP